MQMHMHEHACAGQKTSDIVYPHCLFDYFFNVRGSFSMALNSASRQGWLASELQGSSCLYLPSISVTNSRHHAHGLFCKGSGD